MPYRQTLESCFADAIGEGGVARQAYEAALGRLGPALSDLRRQGTAFGPAWLRLPSQTADLDAAKPVLDHLLNNTTELVVLGTGGSSLGAQALAQAAGRIGLLPQAAEGTPRIHFFDNLDPHTFERALKSFDLRTARFLVISKSGTTAETLAQMFAVMGVLQAAGGGKYMKFHFAAITEPGDNVLRRVAERVGFPVADHDPGIGGRYSVLSNVGLVPALAVGLDAAAVRAGAAAVLDPVLAGARPEDVPAAQGAALAFSAAGQGLGSTVLLAYSDRLERFGQWWRQLWAESLGKDGKGTTPIAALGPVDQHSKLQLWLQGPRDKLFTVLTPEVAGTGGTIPPDLASAPELAYLSGRTIGDLVDAEQRATVETLARNGRPVRTIHLPAIDERTLGALFMHFMLETILTAHLLGVNPFDQPAVEQGKILARDYLAALEVGPDDSRSGP